jgi:hypothetical protein
VRPGSSTLDGVLTSDFDHEYEVGLYYGGERRLPNVPVTGVSFKEDADASIQQSGTLTVVWTDDFATSISPREIADVLAPFGAELYLYSVVRAGRFVERVPIGQFTITDVPSARDEDMRFRGEWITVGSTVELEFKERLAAVENDRFDVPTAVKNLTSVWDEVGRVTRLQILRTLPDTAIARSVVYGDSRLDAPYDLLELLDGVPHMTADGALSGRPKAWPAASAVLKRGEGGSLVSVGRSMSPEKVYNRVAFRGKTNDMEVILASAEITSGPLRTANPDGTPSPFGRKTYFLSSDFVTTKAAAQEYVDRELPRVSSLRSVVVPFVETFNPRRERGDVVVLERAREDLVGRILTIDRGSGPTQECTAEVLLNG